MHESQKYVHKFLGNTFCLLDKFSVRDIVALIDELNFSLLSIVKHHEHRQEEKHIQPKLPQTSSHIASYVVGEQV